MSTSISSPFRPSRQTSAATSWVISDTWSSSRTCSRMQFLARKREEGGGPADELPRSPPAQPPNNAPATTGPQPRAPLRFLCHTHACFPLIPTTVPREDSPSDARPCTPQPAPPTPRALRWGQQRPIICRQRLLKRVGCWLDNGGREGSQESIWLHDTPSPLLLQALPWARAPPTTPAASVRNLGSSLTPPPSPPANPWILIPK